MTDSLAISAIDFTPARSVRVGRCEEAVERYRDAYLAKEEIPPVVVFRHGKHFYGADGAHRSYGGEDAGLTHIDADVTECKSREEAERQAYRFAFGANTKHGLPRTPKDKRAAIAVCLARPENATESDTAIAKVCNVGHVLVRLVREELAAAGKLEGPAADKVKDYKPDATIRGDGRVTDGKGGTRKKVDELPDDPTDDDSPEIDIDEEYGPEVVRNAEEMIDEFGKPQGYTFKPDEVLDARGRPVGSKLAEVFQKRKWFAEKARELSSWLASVKAETGEHLKKTFFNQIEADLENARKGLLSGQPFIVCPDCADLDADPSCGCCKGDQWLPRAMFNQLTPRQKQVVADWEADRKKANRDFESEAA